MEEKMSEPNVNPVGEISTQNSPNQNVEGTISNSILNNPPTSEPKNPESEPSDFSIPEAYKDKTYLKDVKSYDDVFKMLDGAEKLIGQRPVNIPTEESSEEDWNSFYTKLGRPESAEKYEFKNPEGSEGNPDFEKAIGDVLHKAGVSQKQLDVIKPGFDGIIGQMTQEQIEKSDKDFDTLSSKVFGDKKDQILADTKKLLSENKPTNVEDIDEYLNTLDNKSLVVMASVLNNIKEKYISEDNSANQGGSPSVNTDAMRKEAIQIMASEEYRSSFHPNHEQAKQRVEQIYSDIAKLGVRK
jgi:hypothetical protein